MKLRYDGKVSGLLRKLADALPQLTLIACHYGGYHRLTEPSGPRPLYFAVIPPPIGMVTPVTYDAKSLARNRATLAISSDCAPRLMGMVAKKACLRRSISSGSWMRKNAGSPGVSVERRTRQACAPARTTAKPGWLRVDVSGRVPSKMLGHRLVQSCDLRVERGDDPDLP